MIQRSRHAQALTLVEAMLLMVIMSIVALGAGVGMQAVAKVPAKTDDIMAMNSVVVTALEQMRANMLTTWPGATFSCNLYINGTTYSPSSISVGTTGSASAGYSTPSTGTSPAPITLNSKTYILTVSVDEADPAGGTSYKTDFMQVTATCTPVINGATSTQLAQTMRSYVMQP